MRPVVFDSSVYISALRAGDSDRIDLRVLSDGAPVWLSAVVLEELYAGVQRVGRKVLQRLEHDFERANRILVPQLSDWVQTGVLLSQMAERHGYEAIGRARLTNDALIAASVARNGFTLITLNAKDFARLAKVRPFHWEMKKLV